MPTSHKFYIDSQPSLLATSTAPPSAVRRPRSNAVASVIYISSDDEDADEPHPNDMSIQDEPREVISLSSSPEPSPPPSPARRVRKERSDKGRRRGPNAATTGIPSARNRAAAAAAAAAAAEAAAAATRPAAAATTATTATAGAHAMPLFSDRTSVALPSFLPSRLPRVSALEKFAPPPPLLRPLHQLLQQHQQHQQERAWSADDASDSASSSTSLRPAAAAPPPPTQQLTRSHPRTESAVRIDENGQIDWVCPDCTLANPMKVNKCAVCGCVQTRVIHAAARAARAELSLFKEGHPTSERIAAAQEAALRVSMEIEPFIVQKVLPEHGSNKSRLARRPATSTVSVRRPRISMSQQTQSPNGSSLASPDNKAMSQMSGVVEIGPRHQATLPALLSEDERRAERALLDAAQVDLNTPGPLRPRGGLCVWHASAARRSATSDELLATMRTARALARPLLHVDMAVAASDTALATAHAAQYDAAETLARLQAMVRAPSASFHRSRWFYQVSPSEWRQFAPLQSALLDAHRGDAQRVWRETESGAMLLAGVDPNSRPPFLPTDRVFMVDYEASTCVVAPASGGYTSSHPTPAVDAMVPLANQEYAWLDDAEAIMSARPLLASCTMPQCSVARRDNATIAVHAPLCAVAGERCSAPQTPMLSDNLRLVKRVAVGDLSLTPDEAHVLWDPVERALFEALILLPSSPRNHFSSTNDERGVEFGRVAAALKTKRARDVMQFFVDWSQTVAFGEFLARHDGASFATEARRAIVLHTNDYEFEALLVADVFIDVVRSLRGSRRSNANATTTTAQSSRRGPRRRMDESGRAVVVSRQAAASSNADDDVVVESPPHANELMRVDDVDDAAAVMLKTPAIMPPPSDDVASGGDSAWTAGEPFKLNARFDERSLRDCALVCADLAARASRDDPEHRQVLAALLSVTPSTLGGSVRLGKHAALPNTVTPADVALRTRGIYVAASTRANGDALELATKDGTTLMRLLRHLLQLNNISVMMVVDNGEEERLRPVQ
jgi:hypothetical protein